MQANNKDEVQEMINELMKNPGTIGYVLINFDGIPVKYFPEALPAVQYAALIADLVVKTKITLGTLDPARDEKAQFHYLRMRTKQDTELIVTDYTAPSSGNEYIMVVIQQSIFKLEDEIAEGEEEKAI